MANIIILVSRDLLYVLLRINDFLTSYRHTNEVFFKLCIHLKENIPILNIRLISLFIGAMCGAK